MSEDLRILWGMYLKSINGNIHVDKWAGALPFNDLKTKKMILKLILNNRQLVGVVGV